MSTADKLKRAQGVFNDRTMWESLWDIAYRFLAPERNTVFRTQRSPNEIGSEIFDASGVDGAERLVNLIQTGLTPPWQKWMRLEPGPLIQGAERERMRKIFRGIEDRMFAAISNMGFYDEMPPMLLDAVVGGTGALRVMRTQGTLRVRCVPLAELGIEEDYAGRVSCAVHKSEWRVSDLKRVYGSKLPTDVTSADATAKRTVYVICELQADGQWETTTVLESGGGTELALETTKYPTILVFRWSRVGGTPYGRGPGLRALSDVRALNKLKELVLKNAAKAVAGVYTAVNDGVLNPWTVSFEPGAVIPVASNSVNEPSLRELPNTARFDVGQFSMDELRQDIRRTFMADQFGDLARTPRSATEVAERSRILAQDLGAAIGRVQTETLLPFIKIVLGELARAKQIPAGLELDGLTADVQFLSRLAQAQLMSDEQNLVEYASLVTQFGEIDPKAGLVLDVHKALRRLGELKAINPDDMRTEAEIDDIMTEAAKAQSDARALEQSAAGLAAPPPGA